MMIVDELQILFDIINKLQKLNINYMLTGSMAMNYYAEPRMTRDFDIIIEISSPQKKDFFASFSNEYYLTETAFKEAIKYNSMFNIIHKEKVFKADMIIKKKDEYSIQAFERKQIETINKHFVNIISKEDLIISKIEWAKDSKSAQQKADIINLLNTGYNKEYIVRWLKNKRLLDFANGFIHERYFS
ncbi:MAG TPA: hypothetical protein ENL20_09475 [Candidatus Cloacimonetes bacterium]|nr:hypothetical protein [Candidatus Cloacimonadota bacterium]